MTTDAFVPFLVPRAVDAHKASVGRVLVVGGSFAMSGAPALAARGALRAGAGLVTIGTPRDVHAIVAGFQAEAMTVPLPSERGGYLDATSRPGIDALLGRSDLLVLGPGLGREAATMDLVRRYVMTPHPLVLDADALHAIGGRLGDLAARNAPTFLTPHEGEAAALLGTKAELVAKDRVAAAKRIATTAKAICVLKGPGTVVTDGARLVVNATGGPVLAAGGTGDVLSGVVGALVAHGLWGAVPPFDAVATAVHVHGAAGDALAATHGDRGVLASEVADAIPAVLRGLPPRPAP